MFEKKQKILRGKHYINVCHHLEFRECHKHILSLFLEHVIQVDKLTDMIFDKKSDHEMFLISSQIALHGNMPSHLHFSTES